MTEGECCRCEDRTTDLEHSSKAWFIDSVPVPTDMPKEFATSFPPMLKAINNPKVVVTANMNTE